MKLLVLVAMSALAAGMTDPTVFLHRPGLPTYVIIRQPIDLPDAPGPVVTGKKGNIAAGDTLPYTISWGAGTRATSYVVSLSVATTNGTWSVVADSNGSGKWTTGNGVGALPQTSTVTFTNVKTWLSATPWDSATFTVSVASKNSAGTSSAISASWSVKRKPGPPGPIVIDSSLIVTGLLVKPDTSNIPLGTSRIVCAFHRYGNGAVVQFTAFKSSCDSIYTKYIPAASRGLTSVAQQTQTDSLAKSCVTWATSAPALVGFVPVANCANGVRVSGLGITRRFPADELRYAGGRLSPQIGIMRCQRAGDFTATAWGLGHVKLGAVQLHCPGPGAVIFVNPQQPPTFLADLAGPR